MIKDKSSIYLSLFKRKGGEGIETKILDDSNKYQYSIALNNLFEQEKPLIIYFKNSNNWLLFTNIRIIMTLNNEFYSVKLTDIIDVNPILDAEFNNRIFNKNQFTKLKLKLKDLNNVIIDLENGLPFEGLYQVLHFIKNNNVQL